jgi:hypothetical protein
MAHRKQISEDGEDKKQGDNNITAILSTKGI